MREILKIIPVVLYFIVGVISLVMALKSFSSEKFMPFHEQAANKKWDEIDDQLKPVILSILRLSGLGFLVMALLMIICPVVNYFINSLFYKYAIPIIALIFCTGLFINNFLLCRKTKADTPWKGSLYAVFIIIAGIIISFFN